MKGLLSMQRNNITCHAEPVEASPNCFSIHKMVQDLY